MLQSNQSPVELLSEAIDLRRTAPVFNADDGPRDLLEKLQACRSVLEQVEDRFVFSIIARGASGRAVASFKAIYDGQFDAVLVATRSNPRMHDLAPRERYSRTNLEVVEHARSLREAEDLYSQWNDCWSAIRVIRDGLDQLRHDFNTGIRARSQLTSLEGGS